MSFHYEEYRDTFFWYIIQDGIENLIKNNDLEIYTDQDYIVGYLCRQITILSRTHLDGAAILKLSSFNIYGTVTDETGKETQITYIALCRYEGKSEVYIFDCDEELNVIGDTIHDSFEEAIEVVKNSYKGQEIIWYK